MYFGSTPGVCRCEVWVWLNEPHRSEEQGMEAGSSATSLLSRSQSCLLCVAAPTAVGLDGEGGLRPRQLRHRVILRLDADGAARPPCPRGHSRTKKNCSVSCPSEVTVRTIHRRTGSSCGERASCDDPNLDTSARAHASVLRTSKSRPLWPNSSRDGVNLAPIRLRSIAWVAPYRSLAGRD
jgi:hypothetical protein